MSCAIFAAKKILRKQLKDRLRQMTEADKANESSIVAGKVLASEKYSSCQNVCGKCCIKCPFICIRNDPLPRCTFS